MNAATVTVAVGWTSVRPVISDQYVSAVTLPLHLPAVVDDIAVRVAERHAMIKAFVSRTNPTIRILRSLTAGLRKSPRPSGKPLHGTVSRTHRSGHISFWTPS